MKNKVFYEKVVKLAEKHGCSSAQLTLSWLHHQGNDVVPIPGISCMVIELILLDLVQVFRGICLNIVQGRLRLRIWTITLDL